MTPRTVGARDKFPWDHHDGSRATLRTRHGFTPREVFAFHAVLGEARRTTKGQHRELVEVVVDALKRFDVWDAE